MKYEFHVGDYVETKTGTIGYVSEVPEKQKSWILEDAEGKGEYYFDSREVIKKINELADVVNELKTDYEKHLRAHELTER